MVLIDSATDLLAMESGGQYSGAQYEAIQPQLLQPEVFSDPWSDIYLQGAYEKRVQELEQFAQDKNYDYLSLEKGDILDYYDTATPSAALENNRIIRKRRLGPRRRLGGNNNLRNRKKQIPSQNANRRISKEDLEAMSHFYEKEGVYDYVDPLSINDIFISASSNTIADDKYDLSTYDPDYNSHNNNINPQNQSLTRRVANAIFNPTIFAIIAIPLIIAAAYWLFVVNGPTPVVKARIEDVPLEDEETDWTAIAFQILKTYFIPVIQQET